jgi:sugar fermentation stimulation protein A
MRGTYVLFILLDEGRKITAGKLGEQFFPAGYYAYVGSGKGEVEARVARHLRAEKRLHWHIDYLLEEAPITGVSIYDTAIISECGIAVELQPEFDSVKGFGFSACCCRNHLFCLLNENLLRRAAAEAADGTVTLEAR